MGAPGEGAGVKGNDFACFILKIRSSFVPLTATTAVSGGMSIVASSLAAATAALSATLEFDFRRPLATPGATPVTQNKIIQATMRSARAISEDAPWP